MKASTNSLIAALAICAAILATNNATAGGFSFGGGGNSGNKGSFNVNFGNSGHNHVKHSGSFNKYSSCHGDYHHLRYVEPVRIVYSQCYHPGFRCCYVFPGDTWYSISKRIYGVEFLCKHIASYNGLSMYSPLVPGQMLRLPVVNANGTLAASNAPMPAPFAPQSMPFAVQGTPLASQNPALGVTGSPVVPQGFTNGVAPQGMPAGLGPQGLPNGANEAAQQGLPNGASVSSTPLPSPSIPPLETTFTAAPGAGSAASVAHAANIRTLKEEPTLPRVAIGSTLMLDGESLGEEKGIVRLRIGTLTLPVEVIEWTAASVKIELPKMELGQPMKATLEVLRADGSLASKSEIELTPAATRLALGN